jgi:hypothetical protein
MSPLYLSISHVVNLQLGRGGLDENGQAANNRVVNGYGLAAPHDSAGVRQWGDASVLGMGGPFPEKKEGNKRSGASRRRKAKMYQSLNAMVQVSECKGAGECNAMVQVNAMQWCR